MTFTRSLVLRSLPGGPVLWMYDLPTSHFLKLCEHFSLGNGPLPLPILLLSLRGRIQLGCYYVIIEGGGQLEMLYMCMFWDRDCPLTALSVSRGWGLANTFLSGLNLFCKSGLKLQLFYKWFNSLINYSGLQFTLLKPNKLVWKCEMTLVGPPVGT